MSNVSNKYLPINAKKFRESVYWGKLPSDYKKTFNVISEVLPFRVNSFYLENLIDWDAGIDDPLFQLVFPQAGMLADSQFSRISQALSGSRTELLNVVRDVRTELNPHPSGQAFNIPTINDQKISGIQHKYSETALFFPSAGQSCHAYCSFCFRWAQFVGDTEDRFQSRDVRQLIDYLKIHPEITDILITGGDSMIMPTRILERYIQPLLDETHITTIRLGSKALTYWPQRFTKDEDADDLMRLFEKITASGKHLAFMAHINHPRELAPKETRHAIKRILATGAVIRTQAPLLKHVNDKPEDWIDLWTQQVQLGCIPYYMFVERDTGPKQYFEVPLVECYDIFQKAYSKVSGLARSVRGPIMSATEGKVCIDGIIEINDQKYISLQYLQARNPSLCRKPFLAIYDPNAVWFDQLECLTLPHDDGLQKKKVFHNRIRSVEII
ncbi:MULTISPECIES: KamA family radical SAM protein [unclassified Pantoea]|uniref:KamA family radical SAM protein n=1 Tax=unclassified Pantoea TaxID=2630326 RepID=UPI00301C9E20